VSNTCQDKPRRAQPVPRRCEVIVPGQVVVSMTEIAGAAKEGLLALAVGTGMQVMAAMFDEDVTRLCGPDGKHNPDRAGYRHGSEDGPVTLGGRRLAVTRPRVRTAGGSGELHLPGYDLFSSTGDLDPAGAGKDAGRPVVPPLRPRAGARRAGRGAGGRGHLEAGGVPPVRGRDRDAPRCPGAAAHLLALPPALAAADRDSHR